MKHRYYYFNLLLLLQLPFYLLNFIILINLIQYLLLEPFIHPHYFTFILIYCKLRQVRLMPIRSDFINEHQCCVQQCSTHQAYFYHESQILFHSLYYGYQRPFMANYKIFQREKCFMNLFVSYLYYFLVEEVQPIITQVIKKYYFMYTANFFVQVFSIWFFFFLYGLLFYMFIRQLYLLKI